MIAMLRAFGALAGDALIAFGVALRERCDQSGPPPYDVDAFGRMEADGPDAAETCIGDGCPRGARGCFLCSDTSAPAIPPTEIRSALDELPDSQLINIAATVIAGWKPILLHTLTDLTDIDVLIAALSDRAAQFRAVEHDAAEPFLTGAHLGAHLTSSRRGE
jgi:hypothetical protein